MSALPKALKSTLVTGRFIALHMARVRIVPEEPTRVPAMTMAMLLVAKPSAATARPVKELQQRDDDGHVGSADGQHHEHAKNEGEQQEEDHEHHAVRAGGHEECEQSAEAEQADIDQLLRCG